MEKYKIMVKGIVRLEDKYLVVKKWYDDRIAEPYEWGFIDGKIEFMENPDKAVLRLIGEQTSLSATIDKLLYTWTFMTGDVFNIGISYLCLASMETVFLSEDLVDYVWITKDEFDQYIEKKILNDIERVEL
jgi:nucleoside triphosphatase